MNEHLLDELRGRISEMALNAHAEAILARARGGIALELNGPATQKLGESRFGGVPDLPLSLSWPRNEEKQALAFLLQINLSEIPPHDENPFPASGMLYFFLGLDEPATDIAHRILLWQDDAALQNALVPSEDEFIDDTYLNLSPLRLNLKLRAEVPRWGTSDFDELAQEMSDDEQDSFERLMMGSSNEIGQLLGYAAGIGHDPREDAFVVREVNPALLYDYPQRAQLDMTRAANWHCLLRLRSTLELDFVIWDAGYLQFLIHQDDLRGLELRRVYAHVETS